MTFEAIDCDHESKIVDEYKPTCRDDKGIEWKGFDPFNDPD